MQMRSGALALPKFGMGGKGIAVPKFDKDVAVVISTETGSIIEPGSKVTDFRGDEATFRFVSYLPYNGSNGKVILRDDDEDRFSDREVYPSVINAKIIVRADAGPRWEVRHAGVPVGRAEQWSNDRNVLDLDNPKSVSDYQYIAMSSTWSRTASVELREIEPGLHAVYAVREPYTHGNGYKHEDTTIRIVDTWRRSN